LIILKESDSVYPGLSYQAVDKTFINSAAAERFGSFEISYFFSKRPKRSQSKPKSYFHPNKNAKTPIDTSAHY